MRIERLRIGGFGKLRGELAFAPDRCNVVLAPHKLEAILFQDSYGCRVVMCHTTSN